jgi:hypothetical protein
MAGVPDTTAGHLKLNEENKARVCMKSIWAHGRTCARTHGGMPQQGRKTSASTRKDAELAPTPLSDRNNQKSHMHAVCTHAPRWTAQQYSVSCG